MAATEALADKVTALLRTTGLTQDEVGSIVDASARSVARWSHGDAAPQRLTKQRLIELAYVAEAALEILPSDRINQWLFTPSRLLAHDSPATRIRSGAYKDVLDLIDALADGVVV